MEYRTKIEPCSDDYVVMGVWENASDTRLFEDQFDGSEFNFNFDEVLLITVAFDYNGWYSKVEVLDEDETASYKIEIELDVYKPIVIVHSEKKPTIQGYFGDPNSLFTQEVRNIANHLDTNEGELLEEMKKLVEKGIISV